VAIRRPARGQILGCHVTTLSPAGDCVYCVSADFPTPQGADRAAAEAVAALPRGDL